MAAQIHEFPWPMGFGLIGFFIAFFVQFRLKHHIDRDKVMRTQTMADLYPNGIPPKKILTEEGQRLYRWFYIGGVLFAGSIILSMILYGK